MKHLLKIIFVLCLCVNLQAQTFPGITSTIRSLRAYNPPLSTASFSAQNVSDSATVSLDFQITNLTPAYLLNIQIGSAQDSTNAIHRVFKFISANNALSMLANDSLTNVPFYLNNNLLFMSLKVPLTNYSNVKWLTVYYTNISTMQNSIKTYYQFD